MKRVEDSNFCEKHKAKGASLAMLALAEEVVEKAIHPKDTMKYFNGITLSVPNCENAYNNPQQHSIVGQKPASSQLGMCARNRSDMPRHNL